ncbi:hypothetical protein FQA39_LY14178 [Lamprigera yunnana]|nr:hypothetical protein FQA39_LY14178 [Lamprigera yunnana]
MNNLSIFESPNEGEVTLCEVDGKIYSTDYKLGNVSAYTNTLDNHPKILITGDMLHHYRKGDEAGSLFLPVEEPLLKRLIQVYSNNGITEFFNVIKESGPIIIRSLAAVALTIANGLELLQCKFTPRTMENHLTLLSNLAQTRLWLQSSIRCIAWHDYQTKIAIATSDDVVRIYSSNSKVVPILKCKQQRNIMCLAWRPLSNTEIAIGCETGIIVWNVDDTSLITRPSINNATILQRSSHAPVVSLAWSREGDTLASAAAHDSVILMWNVEMNESSSLKESSGHGNCLLKWSPTGNKLLSATTTLIFRVWECQTWKPERWNVLTGRIQACCWSPCGSVILFVTNTEPIIYALSFMQSEMVFANNLQNTPNQAIPVYDLSKGDIDDVVVGGIVINMEWDQKNNYVAILFRDTNYVAIFRICIRPVIKLTPCCLVSGAPEEKPMCISFQGNFQFGTCLSIGWSSGRVQHFPIVFSEIDGSVGNLQNQFGNTSIYNSFSKYSPTTSFLS